ncbi:hypothetical protein NE852_29785 (plasmid) [Rhizobium sp. Pop5]|uniref:hypothetical protein n=1 Tax=Rhizobium sp. Pop5 TaxID=1223565 RepID=UPI0013E2D802|nr:hypothetical protein [Rhizobium sp. Pop5]UVD60769.1 hypothetical protein NE852_29785 [Rhizobium sp. Pop5]
MADIIPFPNPVPHPAMDAHNLNVAGGPSLDQEMDKMLQARASIRKVLDDLDRLNGQLTQLVLER